MSRTEEAAEREIDRYEARIQELERELSKLRTKTMVMGAEPHWLTKDFNVLYRCAQQLADACHALGAGRPRLPPLQELEMQLERLEPAFTDTEEVRQLLRERTRT